MSMNVHDTACRRMADGFTADFVEFAAGHERMHDIMMEIAYEFVKQNIPILDDDAEFDVANELLLSVTIAKV